MLKGEALAAIRQTVDFEELERIAASLPDSDSGDIAKLKNGLRALAVAEAAPSADPGRLHMRDEFQRVLDHAGLKPGAAIAEIGGAMNSFYRDMPSYPFTFLSLYPVVETDHIVADICHCPHIPDRSFDAVLSVSVLEHVRNPWLAGREITRILKPGGVVFHNVPFSYFFHGAPEDYWRYTTTGLEALFPGFETVVSRFDGSSRRHNNLGTADNPVDGDGGAQFAPDAFGGWRENWSVTYAGIKPRKPGRSINPQLIVDLMRAFVRHGRPDKEAAALTAQASRILDFDEHGRLRKMARPRRLTISAARILHLWRHKRKLGILPSHYQFIIPAMFPLDTLISELRELESRTSPAPGA